MAPLQHVIQPPHWADPNRGRGRPRHETAEDVPDEAPLPPPPPPIERRAFDYTALEEAMAHLDAVVRQTRRARSVFAGGGTLGEADRAAAGLERDAIID